MSRSERRGACAPRRTLLAAAFAAALASGCAAVPAPTPLPAGVREWAGRFSVSLASDVPGGRHDAAAGRFLLLSRPAAGGRRLELELASPFGQTMASGAREPDGRSTLTLSDGRTLQAGSLDEVLERALGWPLPIERLPEWLDDRFETVVARDAGGRVETALDSGWRIERDAGRWALQRRVDDGRLRVVLVLDR